MKKIKENLILYISGFILTVAMIVYINQPQATPLNDYVPTHDVLLNDGGTGNKTYALHATSVEEVLNDLNITLNDEDSLNFETNYALQDKDVLNITRVTYEEKRVQVPVKYVTEYVNVDDESLVGTRIKTAGTNGTKDIIYEAKKINGKEVAATEIDSEVTLEPVNRIIEVGPNTTGYKFSGHLTSYGADCIGCGTRTAAGLYVTVNGVKDGGTPVLEFNGGEYYVVAADSQFPFGTIVKISNHNYTFPDPCYALVLDRGGGVKGTMMDIFSGSQANPQFGGHGSVVDYEIIQYGDGRTSIY